MTDYAPTRKRPGSAVAAFKLAGLLLLLPTLLGCPDLGGIQEVAKKAQEAKPALLPIAADFKGTCDRQNAYAGYPTPPAAALPCKNGADLDKLGTNIVAEQSVLLDYFNALGTLAGTDATGFEEAAPALSTTFTDDMLNPTQQEMAGSVGTLAADITKLATKKYREKKLTEILWEANPAVQKLTRGLADQVAPDPKLAPGKPHPPSYLDLLSNEDIQLKTYYEIPLARDPSSTAAVLVLNQYRAALIKQARRKDDAAAYRKFMLDLGKAHAKLLEDAQSRTISPAAFKKMAADLAPTLAEMGTALNTLQEDAR